ncbi:Vacuolar glucose transporter 1 [Cymbomonas tetramitiformis]|uniref:Vacuolar glucose transporter 1 n=1 Tax=Cymbomonas tetramitiformis TaxID=36881 RepID=A0AAE0GGK4_9CHLO|nr:Vacuolar glucose transporter 1 [Cymbomonas tetramitiformis]
MALLLSATCVGYSSNFVKTARYGGRDRTSTHLSRNTRRLTKQLSALKFQPSLYSKSLKRRHLLVKGSVKSEKEAVIPNETEAQVGEEIDWSATIFPFLFPATGGLLFGYEIGATSGAIVSLTSSVTSGTTWYDLSPLASGLIVSGSLGGAMLASAIAVVYGDYLGRKKELVGGAALYTLGASLMAFAPSLPVLISGRLIYGLGIGFTMHGAPMYIAETAPTSVRGTLISLKEGFIVGGILLGYLVSSNFIGDVGGWRSMYGAAVVPAAALTVAMSTVPESPRWLPAGDFPAALPLEELCCPVA